MDCGGVLCIFVFSGLTLLWPDLAGREDHDVTEENELCACELGE